MPTKRKAASSAPGAVRKSARLPNMTVAAVIATVLERKPQLQQYASAFRDNDVDGLTLSLITDQDLEEIGVRSALHRKVILAQARNLCLEEEEEDDEDSATTATASDTSAAAAAAAAAAATAAAAAPVPRSPPHQGVVQQPQPAKDDDFVLADPFALQNKPFTVARVCSFVLYLFVQMWGMWFLGFLGPLFFVGLCVVMLLVFRSLQKLFLTSLEAELHDLPKDDKVRLLVRRHTHICGVVMLL